MFRYIIGNLYNLVVKNSSTSISNSFEAIKCTVIYLEIMLKFKVTVKKDFLQQFQISVINGKEYIFIVIQKYMITKK